MLLKLKKLQKREEFLPTAVSVATHPFYIIRRGLYKRILELSPLVQGVILDFGCGSKPYEALFTNSTQYIGVDIQASGHDHETSKIDFFYDGKRLPFEDSQFDAVVSFEVFEHVFNFEDVLSEIRRVLKPNGLLLISVPFAWAEHEIPYDFARYTSFGLKHILEDKGFEIVSLDKTTTCVLAVCQMFIAYVVQNISPKSRPWSTIFQLGVIFPLNCFSLIIDSFLPKRFEYYSNLIALSRNGKKEAC